MICFSAHAAFVEVDAYSGQIKLTRYVTSEDVGTVINPQIVEAQVQGGVVQGISNCLFEEFVYDENGQQPPALSRIISLPPLPMCHGSRCITRLAPHVHTLRSAAAVWEKEFQALFPEP